MVTLLARLGRDANGDWLARKSIPTAIRGAYRAHYGVQMDEEFRRPGNTPSALAWEVFHDWEAGIAVQIDRARSAVGPKGEWLRCREAQSLTREWRAWVFHRNRKRPKTTAAWEAFLAPVARARAARGQGGADDDASARHRVRTEVATLGRLSEFLAEAEIAVVGVGFDRFVDAVEEQFGRMQGTCRRREARAATQAEPHA